jgi:hypothetical protein
MSGRHWLEALKIVLRERNADAEETPENLSEALSLGRRENVADGPTLVVDEKVGGSWVEDERRLIAAGWEPKERCGKTIWKRPDNGFYCSQETAAHFLNIGVGNVKHKSGAEGER